MSRLLYARSGGSTLHSSSGRRVRVMVYEAETGKRLGVELPEGEDGVDALRRTLYRCV